MPAVRRGPCWRHNRSGLVTVVCGCAAMGVGVGGGSEAEMRARAPSVVAGRDGVSPSGSAPTSPKPRRRRRSLETAWSCRRLARSWRGLPSRRARPQLREAPDMADDKQRGALQQQEGHVPAAGPGPAERGTATSTRVARRERWYGLRSAECPPAPSAAVRSTITATTRRRTDCSSTALSAPSVAARSELGASGSRGRSRARGSRWSPSARSRTRADEATRRSSRRPAIDRRDSTLTSCDSHPPL